MTGSVTGPAGSVPVVSTRLGWRDHLDAVKLRCGIGRMSSSVAPGLYAVGRPGRAAPVLVTANYILSFNHLRRALAGRDAWLLVLDTAGVNVWCAAGKGSFGTAELVARIARTGLAEAVDHRRIVLPQLGATGVAAHEVKRLSGFTVVWGPVRADDLPLFLDHDLVASPAMRRKTFTVSERAVLIPVELVATLKPLALILPLLLLLGGLGDDAGYWEGVLDHGLGAVLAVLAGVVAGAVATPLLLPWLPGRAFSVKAALPALAAALVVTALRDRPPQGLAPSLEVSAWVLIITAVAAFLAMSFTGASTYTSLSGVRREMRLAVPFEIIAAVAGLALWLTALAVA